MFCHSANTALIAAVLLSSSIAADHDPADTPPVTPKPTRAERIPDPVHLDTTLALPSLVVAPPSSANNSAHAAGHDRSSDQASRFPLEPGTPIEFIFPAGGMLAQEDFVVMREPSIRFDPAEIAVTAPARPFSFQFARDTTLLDGGFGNAPSSDDAAGSYFESPGERFDRYTLDLEWTPIESDAQVQWLVLGGIQAVRADIRRLDDASLGITQARGMVAVPTIGTGVRWHASDSVIFSTTASTQSIDQSAGIVDISFSAQFRLSPLVGLTAGYEIFESDMVVENVRTSLDREGVFAKLTIRF